MTRKSVINILAALGVALVSLTGCGGGQDTEPSPPAGATPANAPRLLTDETSAGELLFHADLSPESFGPVALDGEYEVRFAQYAPEDPTVDFSTQTVFEAKLLRVSGPGPKQIALFLDAARSGRTMVTANGRYMVDVSFGDFPFVIRITPA